MPRCLGFGFVPKTNHDFIRENLNKYFLDAGMSLVQLKKKFNKEFQSIFVSIKRFAENTQNRFVLGHPFIRELSYEQFGMEPEDLTPNQMKFLLNNYKKMVSYEKSDKLKRKLDIIKDDSINNLENVLRIIKTEYDKYESYCFILDRKYRDESYKNQASFKDLTEINTKLMGFNEESIQMSIDRITNQSELLKDQLKIFTSEKMEMIKKDLKNEQKKLNEKVNMSNEYLLYFIQFIKLDEISNLFEDNNYNKSIKYENFKLLIKYLNIFFHDTAKTTEISKEGNLVFKNAKKKTFSASQLSSGEKQVLIFFTYLIFKGRKYVEPIMLYDEPDLSLHINWQEKFIDTVLELIPKIQIIVATHSPAIVGDKYDSKEIEIKSI